MAKVKHIVAANPIDNSMIGPMSKEITGLTTGTTYYVRPYAKNAHGIFYGDTTIVTPHVDTLDVSTATFVRSPNISQLSNPYGLSFSTDGTKMCAWTDGHIHQYSLSTAWNVNATTLVHSVTVSQTFTYSHAFSPDGTKMYVMPYTTSAGIYQYNLSTAWDISAATYAGMYATAIKYPFGLSVSSNGNHIFINESGFSRVVKLTITNGNVSSGSPSSSTLLYSAQCSNAWGGIGISEDGYNLLVWGHANKRVYQYGLSSAYNLGIKSYLGYKDIPLVRVNDSRGFALAADDGNFYIQSSSAIHQYSL